MAKPKYLMSFKLYDESFLAIFPWLLYPGTLRNKEQVFEDEFSNKYALERILGKRVEATSEDNVKISFTFTEDCFKKINLYLQKAKMLSAVFIAKISVDKNGLVRMVVENFMTTPRGNTAKNADGKNADKPVQENQPVSKGEVPGMMKSQNFPDGFYEYFYH